ncbi:hypothetical protein NKH77_18710 [Streptomyces sp. M19]
MSTGTRPTAYGTRSAPPRPPAARTASPRRARPAVPVERARRRAAAGAADRPVPRDRAAAPGPGADRPGAVRVRRADGGPLEITDSWLPQPFGLAPRMGLVAQSGLAAHTHVREGACRGGPPTASRRP